MKQLDTTYGEQEAIAASTSGYDIERFKSHDGDVVDVEVAVASEVVFQFSEGASLTMTTDFLIEMLTQLPDADRERIAAALVTPEAIKSWTDAARFYHIVIAPAVLEAMPQKDMATLQTHLSNIGAHVYAGKGRDS